MIGELIKMSEKILIIIPAYNEEKSILNTITNVESYGEQSEYEIDYIVINDGSTDGTKSLLESQHKNVINLVANLGIGGAVQTGYKYAALNNFDVAVQFDGDGQHDIKSLVNLIEPIISGEANFTLGSRFVSNSPSEFKSSQLRQFGIKIISSLIKLVSGTKIYDVTSGYRAVDRNIIDLFCQQYPIKYPEPETLVRVVKKNFRLVEVPANMFERQAGSSSITPIKSIVYMIEVCYSILLLSLVKKEEF